MDSSKLCSVAVMSHPSRRVMVEKLLLSLPPETPVAWADEKLATKTDHRVVWRAKAAALSMHDDRPFHLVLQEDVELAPRFWERLDGHLERGGSDVVYALHYRPTGSDQTRAMLGRAQAARAAGTDHFFPDLGYVRGQGIVVPRHLIPSLLSEGDALSARDHLLWDDNVMAAWLKSHQIRTYAPLPSLVEHTGGTKSLVGYHGERRAWWFETLPEDVVYFVRAGDYNEELRYSLRSVAANLPHKRVWIVGYTPKWVRGVNSIKGNLKASKWLNVADNLRIIAEQVPAESFVVMNDDFFITRPVRDLPPLYRGHTLADHVAGMKSRGSWRESLVATLRALRAHGIADPLSYELHVPVVMDREKLKRAIQVVQGTKGAALPQWRTIYGNIWSVKATVAKDTKTRTAKSIGGPFESSEEDTFERNVRPRMHALFPDPCFYETGPRSTTRIIAEKAPQGGIGMATFRTTLYPALMLRAYDRQFKFVGGRLRVKDADLTIIRDFVEQHPQYRIIEEARASVVVEPAATVAQVPTNAELRLELEAVGLPTDGNKAELQARLEAYGS